ncbi:MAG: zf-HC2 domain-containing protein [candidate division Zixibacteria bacterium]
MSNRHISYLIGDFLDGELTPEKHQEVLDHFSRCPSCARELEQYQRLKSIMGRIETPDPGEDYFTALSDTILNRTEHLHPVPEPETTVHRQSLTRQHIYKLLIRVAAVITLLFVSLFATEFKSRMHVSQAGNRAIEIRADGKNIAGWTGNIPPGVSNPIDFSNETTEKIKNK